MCFPLFFLLLLSVPAEAGINVVTTLTDLRAITAEVGGSLVSVESLAKGTQDPHYLEAKPSFMVKASKADLVISVGLDLESGWLPSIVRGARNPRILPGGRGYLEVGPLVKPLEVAKGEITRAEGDVHPNGNPHVLLDPVRAGEIAGIIATRLGELDPDHKGEFAANAAKIKKRLDDKTKSWQARVKQSGVKSAVTYHKTLTYFLDRFGIANPEILEPKPGIPPTSGHIIDVIKKMREEKIPLILVENVFDPTVTKKIRDELPSVRVATVPIAVEGDERVKAIDDLYEALVSAVEGK